MERAHTPPTSRADEALLADLRRVLAVADPVPKDARLAARLAIEWRTIDAELAALVHDSTIDEPAVALRGAAAPRALTFEAAQLTIEIETEPQLASAGTDLRLVGQLIPGQAAQITIHNGDALRLAHADERGRFDAHGLSHGPLRLRCRLGDARLVETSRLTI
jgi:hypothetical protein